MIKRQCCQLLIFFLFFFCRWDLVLAWMQFVLESTFYGYTVLERIFSNWIHFQNGPSKVYLINLRLFLRRLANRMRFGLVACSITKQHTHIVNVHGGTMLYKNAPFFTLSPSCVWPEGMMQYGICKIVSNLMLSYECILYVCNKIVSSKARIFIKLYSTAEISYYKNTILGFLTTLLILMANLQN